MSRKLSKLICFHNSEWGAEYSSLEVDIAATDRNTSEAKGDVKDKPVAAI